MNKTNHTYTYYPGCSLHSTGIEYGLSTQAVFKHLEMELNELPDWNCCGASSAHALNHTLALALPARNLALAQEIGHDLVTPCAACFNRMKGVDYVLRNNPKVREEIETLVGFHYSGELSIRPIMEILYDDFGLEQLASQVKHPLTGLKVVPYYGCLLVRPPHVVEFDDPDNPQVMTGILRTVGAEVMDWSYSTDCCGAGLSLSRADIVEKNVSQLTAHALEAGAVALVTACPLCQVNLEMRQTSLQKMPAFYITELVGMALGIADTEKWWRKHLIDPRPVLDQAGLS